jgi:hypothetical protein
LARRGDRFVAVEGLVLRGSMTCQNSRSEAISAAIGRAAVQRRMRCCGTAMAVCGSDWTPASSIRVRTAFPQRPSASVNTSIRPWCRCRSRGLGMQHWVATVNGLEGFREYAIPTMMDKQELSSASVYCILAARDGSVGLGTPAGLNRRNTNGKRRAAAGKSPMPARPGARSRELIASALPDGYVSRLFEDVQGRIRIH